MKIFNQSISYTWIKDNMTVILLVPTLLGGLWQVFELANIGAPYIRFFSVSQMVSDGLLMLFILGVVIYASIVFANPAIRFWFKDYIHEPEPSENASETENVGWLKRFSYPKLNRWASWFFILLAGIVIAFAIFRPFGMINPFKTYLGDRTTADSLFLFLIWLVSAMVISGVTIGSILVASGRKLFIDRKRRGGFRRGFLVLVMAVGIFSYRPLGRFFHRSFHTSENFKNLQYVKTKVLLNNPKAKRWSLEYFNDQYLFVKVVDSAAKEKIEVFKFDALFTDRTTGD